MFERVATIDVDLIEGRIHEHGWQSWSPTTTDALTDRPLRPTSGVRQVMNYRPEQRLPMVGRLMHRPLALQPSIIVSIAAAV